MGNCGCGDLKRNILEDPYVQMMSRKVKNYAPVSKTNEMTKMKPEDVEKKIQSKMAQLNAIENPDQIQLLKLQEGPCLEQQFCDMDFKNNSYSLSQGCVWNNHDLSQYCWKRLKQIMHGDIFMFEGEIEPNDIKQGALGDCYFLCSLASLSNATLDDKMIKMIFKNDSFQENGQYVLRLNVDGAFQEVVVDDYFPCFKDGRLAFSHCNRNELWVILLEKAFAKIYGSYMNIEGGVPMDAIQCLTGAPGKYICLEQMSTNDLWDELMKAYERGFMLNAGSKGQGEIIDNRGIVAGHAYSILQVFCQDNVRILKLRNPWGRLEWKGDWSDQSPCWTEELKSRLNVQNCDDGSFWISIEDFKASFENVCENYLYPDYYYRTCELNSFQANKGTFISFKVAQKNTHGYVIVSQPDQKHFRVSDPNYQYKSVRFVVFKGDPNNVECTLGGHYYQDNHINEEFLFEEPGLYHIYVQADEPTRLNVSIYSNQNTSMQAEADNMTHQIMYEIIQQYHLPEMKNSNRIKDGVNYFQNRIGGFEFIGFINESSSNFKMTFSFQKSNMKNFEIKEPYLSEKISLECCQNESKFIYFKNLNYLQKSIPCEIMF